MTDEQARERARKRLAERQARSGSASSSASGSRLSSASSRRPPQPAPSARRTASPRTAAAPASRKAAAATPRPRTGAAARPRESVVTVLLDSAMEAQRSFPLARLLPIAGIVVILIIAIVGIRGCAGCTAQQEAPAQQEQPQQEQLDEATLKARATVTSLLGEDLAQQMQTAAESNGDLAWIAAHPEAYAMDGTAVQRKLLKLAATEPQAIEFVRNFPDSYPAQEGQDSPQVESGTVPRLYQWDPRWGYTTYSSTCFALTGCCPTSLAMVYQGLTGKSNLSPYDLGALARSDGYATTFDGTSSAFLSDEAPGLGLSCESLGVSSSAVRTALQEGKVLICNVGPGDFTENGHFFVISALNADGSVTINDPYSAERSAKAWGIDAIIGQTKALWAYSLA